MNQPELNSTPTVSPREVPPSSPSSERELSLPEMFQSLYLYKKWIALFTLICLLASTVLATVNWFRTKDIERYTCQSSFAVIWDQNGIIINPNNPAQIIDIQSAEYIVDAVLFLIDSENMVEHVKTETEIDMTRAQLTDALSVEQYEETQMVTLRLTWDGSSEETMSILNSVLDYLPVVMNQTLKNGSINIVDRANSPKQVPIPLNIGMILLATAIGLVLACGGAILLGLFRGTVQSRTNITVTLQLDTVGEIPRVDPAQISLFDEPLPPFKYREAYRTFLSILRHRLLSERIQSLYISSSMAHEGKTSLLLNAARSFAEQEGYKVLLVDYDTRKPQIARMLRLKLLGRTLQSVIENKNTMKDAIIPVSEHFHVLCSDASGFLPLNDDMIEQFNALRSEYDFIFFDTPPVGIVSDAIRLNGCTDACLYAIRHNYVTTDIIQKALQVIRQSEHPILGAVLNEIRSNPISQYYYESHYRQYGYYTYDKSPTEGRASSAEATAGKHTHTARRRPR